jgi:hypothetical protein
LSDNIARFSAQFDSDCQGCGNDIVEGEDIGYDKESREYICTECIEERTKS